MGAGVEVKIDRGVHKVTGDVVLGRSVEVGKGVALGRNSGSRQAGRESTRAAGWSVLPN